MTEVGTLSAHDSTASLNLSRSSARSMASRRAPISSIPSSSRIPSVASSRARLSAVWPLDSQHLGDRLGVERLEIRAVGEAGVGHDRRRVRVDDDRAEALFPQHLERLTACVVEL